MTISRQKSKRRSGKLSGKMSGLKEAVDPQMIEEDELLDDSEEGAAPPKYEANAEETSQERKRTVRLLNLSGDLRAEVSSEEELTIGGIKEQLRNQFGLEAWLGLNLVHGEENLCKRSENVAEVNLINIEEGISELYWVTDEEEKEMLLGAIKTTFDDQSDDQVVRGIEKLVDEIGLARLVNCELFVLAVVRRHIPYSFQILFGRPGLSHSLRNDRLLALEAVRIHPKNLLLFSPALRDTFEIGLAAVKRDGKAITYLSKRLQSDERIVAASKHPPL